MNDENENRWIWAPMIGHGIGLVTLGGIVGNVPSPDTALYALGPAISCFAIGLIISAVSASVEGEFLSKTNQVPSFRPRTHEIEERRAALLISISDLKQTMHNSNATISEQVVAKARIEALEAQANIIQSLNKSLDRDLSSIESWMRRGKLHAALTGALKAFSYITFFWGMMALLQPLWKGDLHLEKREERARPVAEIKATATAPATQSAGAIPASKPK